MIIIMAQVLVSQSVAIDQRLVEFAQNLSLRNKDLINSGFEILIPNLHPIGNLFVRDLIHTINYESLSDIGKVVEVSEKDLEENNSYDEILYISVGAMGLTIRLETDNGDPSYDDIITI